jgi:hypothetical protein
MLKPFNQYTLEIYASVDRGITAQILCDQNTVFIGRIDFYVNEAVPTSYLWNPNNSSDPTQIYIVLAMPIDRFEAVEEILRSEQPFGLELSPSGPMTGAVTDGFGGVLRSLSEEPVDQDVRQFYLTPRQAAEKYIQRGVRDK